ncbi:MAG: hypothetical protein ABIK28_07360 [Planctomycetota bacterium]
MSGTPKVSSLSGTYTPSTTGLYKLSIRNYRTSAASTTLLNNYVDHVSLVPQNPTLSADTQVFSAFYGTPMNFDLNAGSAYAGHDYWLWVGYSGTYPGITLGSGPTIPLNYDYLVELGLAYPGFPGTGFIGQLDASGQATAGLTFKPNMNMVGMCLYFSYVVLSPGGTTPVLMASNPTNGICSLLMD